MFYQNFLLLTSNCALANALLKTILLIYPDATFRTLQLIEPHRITDYNE